MVLSYYFLKIPYTAIYHLLKLLKLNNYSAAYCDNVLDYRNMEPVLKLLPDLKIIAKNKKIKRELEHIGISSTTLPAFPKNVLMCRLSAHKFPAKAIKKIGMRHGPFHFKALPGKESFELFHTFIFTSKKENQIAQNAGIYNGIGLGYPKLDPAFNGTFSENYLNKLARDIDINPAKKTLLFTATWQNSNMSATELWIDKLSELTNDFNIMVTLHPWTKREIVDKISKMENVYFIRDYNTIPYIMLADICIGDTSSILAECCSLDKPIITFITKSAKRSVPYVMDLIAKFSIQIKSFSELIPVINLYLENPELKKTERLEASKIMFSNLDGTAAAKIANYVKKSFFD